MRREGGVVVACCGRREVSRRETVKNFTRDKRDFEMGANFDREPVID